MLGSLIWQVLLGNLGLNISESTVHVKYAAVFFQKAYINVPYTVSDPI